MQDNLINVAYIIAAILFIMGIKMLGSASTAVRGNRISSLGMLLAVVVTLLRSGLDYQFIILGLIQYFLFDGSFNEMILWIKGFFQFYF